LLQGKKGKCRFWSVSYTKRRESQREAEEKIKKGGIEPEKKDGGKHLGKKKGRSSFADKVANNAGNPRRVLCSRKRGKA